MVSGTSISQREAAFRLAKVDHIERQREIGVIIDRVATQQLRGYRRCLSGCSRVRSGRRRSFPRRTACRTAGPDDGQVVDQSRAKVFLGRVATTTSACRRHFCCDSFARRCLCTRAIDYLLPRHIAFY